MEDNQTTFFLFFFPNSIAVKSTSLGEPLHYLHEILKNIIIVTAINKNR